MSDNNESDGYEAHETDWLANSGYCFGYGYTKEQALQAMCAHFDHSDPEAPITVDLVEHVGHATTSMGGWRVDTFVSGERIELSYEQIDEIRKPMWDADGAAERILESVDVDDIDA